MKNVTNSFSVFFFSVSSAPFLSYFITSSHSGKFFSDYLKKVSGLCHMPEAVFMAFQITPSHSLFSVLGRRSHFLNIFFSLWVLFSSFCF